MKNNKYEDDSDELWGTSKEYDEDEMDPFAADPLVVLPPRPRPLAHAATLTPPPTLAANAFHIASPSSVAPDLKRPRKNAMFIGADETYIPLTPAPQVNRRPNPLALNPSSTSVINPKATNINKRHKALTRVHSPPLSAPLRPPPNWMTSRPPSPPPRGSRDYAFGRHQPSSPIPGFTTRHTHAQQD